MPHPNIALWLFGLAVLWLIFQFALREAKCRYCGRINDHDPHCPFQNSGLTGA